MGEHSRYHANRATERWQIERLLTYPKVDPLSAAAIAINLGTPTSHIEPILAVLAPEGIVEKVDDDLYIGRGIGLAGERRASDDVAECE